MEEQELRNRYGLSRAFVMYTGGIDFRKNIEKLIDAYAQLPNQLRATHQLAIVCSVQENEKQQLLQHATKVGLGFDELILTGFVPDDDLIALYNLCHLFVFPSLYEGFGLPALEAMTCGAAVIGSNTSSIPEVIGCQDALFDPSGPLAIAETIARVLSNPDLRQELRRHGEQQARQFSWHKTARRALSAFENIEEQNRAASRSSVPVVGDRPRLAFVSPLPPLRSGVAVYIASSCLSLRATIVLNSSSNRRKSIIRGLRRIFQSAIQLGLGRMLAGSTASYTSSGTHPFINTCFPSYRSIPAWSCSTTFF